MIGRFGSALAHAARDAMGEVGTVDDDERVGPGGDDRVRRLADAARGSSAARLITGTIPMTAMSPIGKEAPEALRLHRLAADADEGHVPRRLAQRAHELETELVAGMFSGDEGDGQRPVAAHAPKP